MKNGLPTNDFASGTSLYLAIVHNSVSVSKGGRIPMYATSFSLSPGPQGPMGPMGVQGLTGATGTTGVQGPQGINGATGAMGPQGPKRDTGASGATGGTGATGTAGAAGPQGPAGTNGTGFNFRNAFDPTAVYAVNDVVAYNGSTYVANTVNGPNTLTPDTNPSAWAVMAAAGATGAGGAAGAIGPQGPIGIGLPGATGATGAQGAQGIQGIPGTNGTDGAQGMQGPQGLPGVQGIQGIQGTNGTNGAGFNPRGSWNSATSYAINDVVSCNGSSYVAVVAAAGQQPDLTSVPSTNVNFTLNDPSWRLFTMTLPISPTPQNLAAGETLSSSPNVMWIVSGVPATRNGSPAGVISVRFEGNGIGLLTWSGGNSAEYTFPGIPWTGDPYTPTLLPGTYNTANMM